MASRQSRFYGLMQRLLFAAVPDADPLPPSARGEVVAQQDALTAVLLLAAAIDQSAQAGLIPREQAEHMAEMLMVIREYVKPLPAFNGGPNDEDLVTPDLEAVVTQLRQSPLQT